MFSKMEKKNYFETRSIKTRITLVEHKTISHEILLITQNWFLPVFTEVAPEVERNTIK